MQAAVDLSYPIGRFDLTRNVSPEERPGLIAIVEGAPGRFREAVKGLDEAQLDTPYRPGGWTVRQLVHHVPDSHMNAYVRFKLAATEEEPTIKPYEEARWADLADAKSSPIEPSLALLENLHKRWVLFLRSLGPVDWSRKFRHPELGTISLEQNLALYAWHGKHHVAHVTALRERQNWR